MKIDCFTASECVDGNCPIALANEFPWVEGAESCEVCPYNANVCSKCIFEKSDWCDKQVKIFSENL